MTPRRILLLLGGLLAFGGCYTLYARVFGWLDGLPVLPPEKLLAADGSFRPPPRVTSPTIERLKEAFGPDAPETEPAFYPTQLEFRSGETSIVLAAGSPPSTPNSNRVTLKPFSVAVFSKPRPAHLLQPGEVPEISTLHADKGVLVFDRVIENATQMNNARLVRLELISDLEEALPDRLRRQGLVHITNNQRSADPNRALVLRTVGPVFYRDPKYASGPELLGPDIWTDAPVEIVDRSNLPRPRSTVAAVAPAAAEVFRKPSSVAEVLEGHRLPPPTLTAVGMRVYLEADSPPATDPGKPARPTNPKKGSAGFSGVRKIDLLERVVLNLWVDGGQSLVGSAGKAPVLLPPPEVVAIGSGLIPAAQLARHWARDLVQIETRGPFSYDAEKNLARFDVLPQADPNLLNDVRVTRVTAQPGIQTLFSQVLEIEFHGSPTGTRPTAAPAATSGSGAPAPVAATAAGPRFKRLHAWTYTPGRVLTISSDPDQLEAYGTDLVRDQASERTQLTGSPLYAVQQRNVLTAGTAKTPATLILEPSTSATAERKLLASVRGPGRVDLFDATAGTTTTSAAWQTSMVQTRERAGETEVELYTFTDNAQFADTQADFWLKAQTLKLWLAPKEAEATGPAGERGAGQLASRTKPHRVQALGQVSGHSADLDIEQTDQLNTWFKDIPPPPTDAAQPPGANPAPPPPAAEAKSRPRPESGSPPGPQGKGTEPREPRPAPHAAGSPPPAVAPAPVAPAPDAPEKPKPTKPPLKLKARTIETWVARYPVPASPDPNRPASPRGPASGSLKYQLEHAHCEGMVSVHQDPDSPTKPRGTDILGSKLLIDGTFEGSILTVFGWENRPAEVHSESTSLIGSKVVVDQLHNLAVIEGRGSVAMATASDLSGGELPQPEVVVIQFRDGMTFKGAQKTADFFGKVTASQGASWVTCHTLQVIFDRPIYFTQSNRPPTAPVANAGGPPGRPADDKAKVDVIYCYPAPADQAESAQERLVSFLQVERDATTGQPIRRQQLVARELTLRAQVREDGQAEPYKMLFAYGPGEVRTWQPGTRDDAPAAAPGGAPAETEMKLTIVTFSGRMIAKDKGKLYQDATFYDTIQVIHVPTDNPDLTVDRHRLPPRAVLLNCSEKLIVWSHKKPNTPSVQHMEAYGNAYLQNEEYDGWGEVVTHTGKQIVFDDGTGFERRVTNPIPARIKSRFKSDDNSGRRIIYDRETNHYQVIDAVGGTITSSPSTTPKTNPPPPAKKKN
jgi:hypothetical protein